MTIDTTHTSQERGKEYSVVIIQGELNSLLSYDNYGLEVP